MAFMVIMEFMYINVAGFVHCHRHRSRPPTLLTNSPQLAQLDRTGSLTPWSSCHDYGAGLVEAQASVHPKLEGSGTSVLFELFMWPSKTAEAGATTAPATHEDEGVAIAHHDVSPEATPPQQVTTSSDCYPACVIEEELPDLATREREHGQAMDCTLGTPAMQFEEAEPPSLTSLHPDHLQLIFDLRGSMDDLMFRTEGVSRRLDMFHMAYSPASPSRRCPTCAQAFTFTGNGGSPTN